MSENFFSDTKCNRLVAFPLNCHYDDHLDPSELSRLVAAFNSQFAFYNLFVQFAIANSEHGKYHLWVIKASTQAYAPNTHTEHDSGVAHQDGLKLCKEDELKFSAFVAGFIHGVRAYRKKKPRYDATTRRY